MPFANFTEISDSIISWSHRGDLNLLVPDFIALAECEMYNPSPIEGVTAKPLELKQLEATTTIPTTTTSEFINLPADYASMRSSRLDILNSSDFLEYRTPDQLKRFDTTSRPCFFTIIGTQIEFDRVPDEIIDVEIQYYSKAAALTALAPTNAVLTNHPTIYLYGALAQLFTHSGDDENKAKYERKFMGAVQGANQADRRGRFGPSPVMKVEGSTP